MTLVLGAGGYLGETTIRALVATAQPAVGLVRRSEAAVRLRALGADVIVGDAEAPASWQAQLAGVGAVIDLVQPAFPKKITVGSLQKIAVARAKVTRAVAKAIAALPPEDRPLYIYVGGCDELEPTNGTVTDSSPERAELAGGGRIGAPSRQILRDSGIAFTSVYFGTVYGGGKAFASTILPGLAAGTFPIIGSGKNKLPLVHVDDAASALAHLSSMVTRAATDISGRSFVVAQPGGETAAAFFDAIAHDLGARAPRHMPAWLVKLVAGAGAVELMSGDAQVESAAILASGFRFRHATLTSGVSAMIEAYQYGGVGESRCHADV